MPEETCVCVSGWTYHFLSLALTWAKNPELLLWLMSTSNERPEIAVWLMKTWEEGSLSWRLSKKDTTAQSKTGAGTPRRSLSDWWTSKVIKSYKQIFQELCFFFTCNKNKFQRLGILFFYNLYIFMSLMLRQTNGLLSAWGRRVSRKRFRWIGNRRHCGSDAEPKYPFRRVWFEPRWHTRDWVSQQLMPLLQVFQWVWSLNSSLTSLPDFQVNTTTKWSRFDFMFFILQRGDCQHS